MAGEFERQLRNWTVDQLRRRFGPRDKLSHAIRRLIDYPYRGEERDPQDRGAISGRVGAAIRYVIPQGISYGPGGFCYYPISDTSVYGWGLPFTAGNRPLGTALSSSGPLDASQQGYRRCESDDGTTWTVTHEQEYLGGRRWKKRSGKVISWYPPQGWEDVAPAGMKSGPIFYAGEVLAGYPDSSSSETWRVIAASWATNGGTDYIYALVQQKSTTTFRVVYKEVDWSTPAMVGSWSESNTFLLPSPALGLRQERAGGGDINASCTEATLISHAGDGHRVEVSVTWASWPAVVRTVVTDSEDTHATSGNWLGVSYSSVAAPACVSASGYGTQSFDNPYESYTRSWDGDMLDSYEVIILARYLEDSDTLTRQKIKIVMGGGAQGSNVESHTWTDDGGGCYGETAFSVTQNRTNTKYTNIEFYTDGTLEFTLPVYSEVQTNNFSLSDSWTFGNGGCPPTPDDPTGSGAYSYDEKVYEVALPARMQEPLVSGIWYQDARTYRKQNSWSYAGSQWVYRSSTNTCMLSEVAGAATEIITTDQPIRTRIDIQGENIYDETRTVESGVYLDVDTDRTSYWRQAFNLGTFQAIAERTIDYAGAARPNGAATLSPLGRYKGMDVMFLPGNACVGNFWLRDESATTESPVVFFSGGDLMTLTEAVGDDQRLRRWTDSIDTPRMGVIE